MFKTRNLAALGAAVFAFTASVAQAVPPDFSGITGAVDWTTVGAGILAIASLKAVPLVVSVGAKMVLRMICR